MALYFECSANGGTNLLVTTLTEAQVKTWEWAFGREDLAGLFDMTPGPEAVIAFDNAKRRVHNDPRHVMSIILSYSNESQPDWLGVRGNYLLMESVRTFLAANEGAVISGAIEDSVETDELPPS